MPDVFTTARDKEKDYRWTRRLVTNVYADPESVKPRRVEAHLLAGEWTKYLEDKGEEIRVHFRGGEGYVRRDEIGGKRILEIYFIDVGQGDSILVETPSDERVLIDGGADRSAHSFLRWKYRLEEHYKEFRAIIMTHGDEDHAAGLISILNDEHIVPREVYHNGIAKQSDGSLGSVSPDGRDKMLVDLYDDTAELKPKYDKLSGTYRAWVDAVAKARNRAHKNKLDFRCIRADQNTEPLQIGGPNGVKITFLGPVNVGDVHKPGLRVFGNESQTINGNSVSLLLEYGRARVLLSGDLNEPAEEFLIKRCPKGALRAQVFKANHHGSQHFSVDFLKRVRPWITVVSSGDYPDYGHPRANLLGSLGRQAPEEIERPLVFSTELAATFRRIPESRMRVEGRQVYEKTIHGMINVRTDGNWIAAGRVYGRVGESGRDKGGRGLWKWEAYAFNLSNGRALSNKLLED